MYGVIPKYIIGHYNPSVWITDLVSHISLMLCVLILYVSGGTYSLKSTPNDRFFEKLFMPMLFTLRVFARNLLRGNRRRNTFRISFWCLAWDTNPGFSSNNNTLPTRPRRLHTNYFTKMADNFKVVFLIDPTILWQEFMMHHAIAIEENNKHDLHIWSNLTCFFWVLTRLNASIGMIGLWFKCRNHKEVIFLV